MSNKQLLIIKINLNLPCSSYLRKSFDPPVQKWSENAAKNPCMH